MAIKAGILIIAPIVALAMYPGLSMGQLLLLIVAAIVYMLPTLVAYQRHRRNRALVMVLDIVLGWSLVGWIISLALATDVEREDASRRA